jgi:hypothetical protein
MVGRTGAPNPDARTRCRSAPALPGADPRRTGYAAPVPRLLVRSVLLASLISGLAACTGSAAPSFDPTGACTSDGSAPGAYPDLEARVPTTYRDAAPEKLDSGRNCSRERLGSLADLGFGEVRFAGATWSFGAERALALVVFSAPGLDADEIADFYAESARSASRTEILAESDLTAAGRAGRRLDTKTGERLQTVVSWPASAPDVVNVVITNDLPDERINDAIASFGER